MKRTLLVILLNLTGIILFSQKVTVKVILSGDSRLQSWQILDNQGLNVFEGQLTTQPDSVFFSLDANRHYFLKLSLNDSISDKSTILSLGFNGEPLLLIMQGTEKGEHLYPFFTGVRAPYSKITGGTTALISDFPWQVYYIAGNYRCGGSIISPRWILTAAHCTKNGTGGAIAVTDMAVRVGLNSPSNSLDGKTYTLSEVIVHEGFDSQTLLNDIALLHLKDSINYPNATPIKLVTTDDAAQGATDPGVLSWVTGWGYTHVSPNVIPSSLQKVQLPIVTNEQASAVWTSIPATDMMAGFLNGNKDACNGDSGGPLVVPVLNEYRLAGIVSWGSSTCNTYGAYTRVSALESWIRTKTGISRNLKPPAPLGDTIVCQNTVSSQFSVPLISGATSYEWGILPQNAGVITGSGQNASVLWNISYTGPYTIILRATVNNALSDWSRLDGNVVLNTVLSGQSGDTTICAGKQLTLKVSVTGHNLAYKWYRNNQLIQSGLSPNLLFQPAYSEHTGQYICKVTGSCGSLQSAPINLTVYPVTRITYLSPSADVVLGSDVELSVTSEGHDLSYLWQKDGVALENSNTARLAIPDLNANDIGLYRTTVTGTCGVVRSDSIYLYVSRSGAAAGTEVIVWPTVTSSDINVALSNNSTYKIEVFNTMGKKMKEIDSCQYQTNIYIGVYAKGVYLVRVSSRNFSKTVKIIRT